LTAPLQKCPAILTAAILIIFHRAEFPKHFIAQAFYRNEIIKPLPLVSQLSKKLLNSLGRFTIRDYFMALF
jgi:hypothetical protein